MLADYGSDVSETTYSVESKISGLLTVNYSRETHKTLIGFSTISGLGLSFHMENLPSPKIHKN